MCHFQETLVAMVLVAAIALSSATYAWFVNNTAVTATGVSVNATTAYSLMIKGSSESASYSTTTALDATQNLTPVSTIGTLITTANSNLGSAVGDLQFFKSNEWNGDGQVKTFTEVSKSSFDDLDGDGTKDDGESTYYYMDTVYLKAGQASKIYLDNSTTGIVTTDDNGSSLTKFDSNNLDANNQALLETMRVAFVVSQTSGDTTTRKVYAYQLNATSSGTGKNYNTTIPVNGTTMAEGLKYATSGTSSVAAVTFANLSSDSVKALTDSVMAKGSQSELATAETTTDVLATVTADEEIQVDIYLWMEGCDYDTTAANSADFASTIGGMQFGFCIGSTGSTTKN